MLKERTNKDLIKMNDQLKKFHVIFSAGMLDGTSEGIVVLFKLVTFFFVVATAEEGSVEVLIDRNGQCQQAGKGIRQKIDTKGHNVERIQ